MTSVLHTAFTIQQTVQKAVCFVKLWCGWMRVKHLWVGITSDSHYQEDTKIFDNQQAFAAETLVDRTGIPFTCMLDKGWEHRQ